MFNLFWKSSPKASRRSCPLAFLIPTIFLFLLAFPARSARAKFAHRPRRAGRARTFAQVGGATAAQATPAFQGIAGQIIDSATQAPISAGQVIVALEQQDGTGTDVIFTQAEPDSSGRFSFDPLPLAATFDLVAIATSGGIAYDATVVIGIPAGTELGEVPLIAETSDQHGPAKIEGIVAATSGTAPSSIRATISAIQMVSLRDGFSLPADVPLTVTIGGADYRPITIPGQRGTSANVLLRSTADCPASVPPNSNCGGYAIVVPGGSPNVGVFASGKVSYQPPVAGPASYIVRANAFALYGMGAGVCVPSFQSVGADAQGQPLKISPGGIATAQPIAFSGCW